MNYFDEYFSFNKRTLTVVGEWPLQSKIQRKLIGSALLISTLFQIAGEVRAPFFMETSKIISDTFPVYIFNLICFVKAMNNILFNEEMSIMLRQIKEFWENPNVEKHQIHHDYAKKGLFLSHLLSNLLWTVGVIFLLTPLSPKIFLYLGLIDGPIKIEYPYPAVFPFNEERYFVLIDLHMAFTVMILTTLIAANDSLFFAFVQHACGMFAEVRWQLEHLAIDVNNIEIQLNADKHEDHEFRAIVKIVRKHKKAIEFSQLINVTYRWSFFFIVALNAGMISATSLQILHSIEQMIMENILRLVSFVVGQFVHLGFECYVSQDIINHSNYVGEAVMKTNWYLLTLRTRKLLNLISIRCRVPCMITAGSIFTMSIPFYGDLVKSSISYFTMLRSTETNTETNH